MSSAGQKSIGAQRRAAMLAHLRDCFPYAATIRDLARATGLSSTSTVWNHVQDLVKAGLVESRGKLGVLITARGRDTQPPPPLPEIVPMEFIL